jgi:hypothetical protein
MGNYRYWQMKILCGFPMGNNKLGKKEITQLFKEGWKIRIKKVKQQRYLSIRQGNNERGLGAFNQEKYSELMSLQSSLQTDEPSTEFKEASVNANVISLSESIERHKRITEELKTHLEKIQLYRGIIKMSRCAHIKNGYCTFWNWRIKEEIHDSHTFKNLLWEPEVGEITLQGTDEHRWVIRAAPSYCEYCGMFKQLEGSDA